MPANELHPTDEFFKRCLSLREQAGESVLKALGSALNKLKAYTWDGSLPIQPHGASGRTYHYSFHPPYQLIFDRETDRDASKRPVKVHLVLLTIEREPN